MSALERCTGIPKILRSLKDNGSPPAEFETDENRSYFLAVLPSHAALLLQTNLSPSSEHLTLIIDDLHTVKPEFKQTLLEIAREPRLKAKLGRDKVISVILELCNGQYMTLPVLAELLNRSPDALRIQYLKPLIKAGQIGLAFPSTPTHPRQAYKKLVGTKK